MTNHEQVDTAPAKCVACGKRLDVGEVHCWTCEERRRSPSPAHGGTSAMEEKLRELEAKATPGPWRTETHGRSDDKDFGAHYLFAKDSPYPWSHGHGQQPDGFRSLHGCSAPLYKADADLIVELRNAIPALLARLAALTRENEQLRARAEKARGDAVEHQRLSAKLYVALELSRCECGVSVQPPRAMKCARCAALEDADKLRALAHDEGRGTT